MNWRTKISNDIVGLALALIVFALIGSCVMIFWQAQVIAQQDAVIRMMETR